jgi:signal transduction histidine kinase
MRTRRLHTRIYLHLVLVLCVAAVATVALLSMGWRNAFARTWAVKFARHTASVIGDHFDDPARRERIVHRISEELDFEITVRDADGRVLVTAGPELPPMTADDARLRDGPVFIGERGHWFSAAPIFDGGGRLRGVIEAAPMRRLRPPNLWRSVGLVAAVLAIFAVLTAPLARRITRPVEALTEASRRLAGGDLAYRVPIGRRRRRSHDQLDELTRAWNEMAERVELLVRGQKELLANVSHELRSPLARLRVALELMPGEDTARIAQMETDLGELDALIETLLTSSRLEASGLPTHIERVEVGTLFAGLAERAARDPIVGQHELRLAPVPDDARELSADGALLLRALWNLVENAAKYGAPPIAVAARRDGARIAFTVVDEGPGIPPAERERVFTPFYRVPGAERRGFGLGLTLAKRIAEVHGGSIRIASTRSDGSGCAVTLTLPVAVS